MNKLFLYTVHQGNLQYSCIPQEHYTRILDQTYWPIINLLDEYKDIGIGISFTAYSLQILERLDPLFIKKIVEYQNEGRLEIIGHGLSQGVFALIPYEVNQQNLKIGMDEYQRILGKKPRIVFVNEQVYAPGLPRLYKEAGYEAIYIEWESVNTKNTFPADWMYRPQWAVGVDGTRIRVLWNISERCWRFGIYSGLETITLDQYITSVKRHHCEQQDRMLLLYGGDWETLNYHTREGQLYEKVIDNYRRFLDYISTCEWAQIVTPGKILDSFPSEHEMKFESPSYPLPCWTGPHYNLTRWAVSGRDDVKVNTLCHRLFKCIKDVQVVSKISSSKSNDLKALWTELVLLWDSDIRTWVTEDKYEDFKLNAGKLNHLTTERLNILLESIPVKEDMALINTNDDIWAAEPFVINCTFPPGKYHKGIAVEIDGKPSTSQMENATCYQDGSIRSVDVVILPTINPGQISQVKILDNNKYGPAKCTRRQPGQMKIQTEQVIMELMNGNNGLFEGGSDIAPQGCTILGAVFAEVDPNILFGNFRSGFNLLYSADFQMKDSVSGRYLNDWGIAEVFLPEDLDACSIRIPVFTRIKAGHVVIEKTFFVYRHLPRIDVKWFFTMAEDTMPEFCRINTMSINPDAFERKSLKYSLVNGSNYIEQYALNGADIRQDECISRAVTTTQCMGDSEGWIDISDRQKGVTLISDKTGLYSIPLLRYEQNKNNYLLTVKNSIGESDCTGSVFYRGYNTAYFAYVAHNNNIEQTRKIARHINNKLIVKSKYALSK